VPNSHAKHVLFITPTKNCLSPIDFEFFNGNSNERQRTGNETTSFNQDERTQLRLKKQAAPAQDRGTLFRPPWGARIDYRVLGRTGLSVSAICVATSSLGSHPAPRGTETAVATIRRVLDSPFNFIEHRR
jgi:hypothetical protein